MADRPFSLHAEQRCVLQALGTTLEDTGQVMLSPDIGTPRSDRALLVAFFLSGCAALGYEFTWTRALSLALGHEALAMLGTLAGFFGGMAAGAFVLHERARRVPNPCQLFVRLEVAAALFALVSPWALLRVADFLPRALGPFAGDNDSTTGLVITVVVAGALLLPGTFCLGATLPALVETRRRSFPDEVNGRGLGRLYAANTVGATVGVLATVHMLLPTLGLVKGAIVLAATGLCSAAVARLWSRTGPTRALRLASGESCSKAPASAGSPSQLEHRPQVILMLMLGTGLVGVGLEVVGVQVLSQVLENTVYTFADVLAVYLLGTAGGAALYARYAKRAVEHCPETVTGGALLALALSALLAAWVLVHTPSLLQRLAPEGSTYVSHLVSEAVVAALVFGPATILMGGLFAHLTGLLAPRGIGRGYALNTVGSALAPLIFGVWLIESAGYSDAMYMVVYAYLVLYALYAWSQRFRLAWQIGPIVGVLAATACGPESLILVQPDANWTTLESRETLLGLVVVSESLTEDNQSKPLRRLQVGHHFRMGGSMAFGERRMGSAAA